MDKGDECLAAIRLRTVDGEVRIVRRSQAYSLARLCNVVTKELIEANATNRLQQGVAIPKVECVVEVAKHSVVVSRCLTTVIPLRVEQCVDVEKTRVAVSEVHQRLFSVLSNECHTTVLSAAM